jgi:hypothetical protein
MHRLALRSPSGSLVKPVTVAHPTEGAVRQEPPASGKGEFLRILTGYFQPACRQGVWKK